MNFSLVDNIHLWSGLVCPSHLSLYELFLTLLPCRGVAVKLVFDLDRCPCKFRTAPQKAQNDNYSMHQQYRFISFLSVFFHALQVLFSINHDYTSPVIAFNAVYLLHLLEFKTTLFQNPCFNHFTDFIVLYSSVLVSISLLAAETGNGS